MIIDRRGVRIGEAEAGPALPSLANPDRLCGHHVGDVGQVEQATERSEALDPHPDELDLVADGQRQLVVAPPGEDDRRDHVVGRAQPRGAAIWIDHRPVLQVSVAVPRQDAEDESADILPSILRAQRRQYGPDLFGGPILLAGPTEDLCEVFHMAQGVAVESPAEEHRAVAGGDLGGESLELVDRPQPGPRHVDAGRLGPPTDPVLQPRHARVARIMELGDPITPLPADGDHELLGLVTDRQLPLNTCQAVLWPDGVARWNGAWRWSRRAAG